MSKIRDAAGYPFRHEGQLYSVICLLGSDGWSLYVNHCPDGAMAVKTGHRASLPASASDEDLQAAAAELQRRVEAGHAPDEAPEADSPNTAFDL